MNLNINIVKPSKKRKSICTKNENMKKKFKTQKKLVETKKKN